MATNGNQETTVAQPVAAWKDALCIFVVTLLGNLVLILNPGFFSHDEWQKYDFVTRYGYGDAFVQLYGKLRAGPNFGFPVRPLGFLQQGFVSQWMVSEPIIPHLFSVLLHAVTALMLWWAMRAINVRRGVALRAGILFAISPLALFAVGWTAASFDQWYVLFALAAVSVALSLAERGFRLWSCLLLLVWSAGAMLSKETAMVLPAAVGASIIGKNLIDGRPLQWKAAILSGLLSALPVIGFLWIRLPAIMNTLHGAGGSSTTYKPSLSLVVPNAADYFQYPFLWNISELVNIGSRPTWFHVFACVVHLAVIAALYAKSGWRVVLAYLVGYFVFLLPVLTIPGLGAHYLYASAIPLSIALAYLLDFSGSSARGKMMGLVVAVVAVIFLVMHSYHIEKELRHDGVCQMRFLNTLDSQMAKRPVGADVDVIVPFGSPGYVGVRSTFGRDKYEKVHFDESGKSPGKGDLVMERSCEVVENR